MPRKPRIDFPGAWHHVMHRGARRAPIFKEDAHCILFLECLARVVDEHELELHAYSLMPNHYHLLVRSRHGNLSRAMRRLNAEYTQRVNLLERWDGPVFRGRFHSQLVADETRLSHVLAYIHLNPLRTNLVTRLDSDSWTSHRAYIGRDAVPDWLTVGHFLELLSGASSLHDFVLSLHRGSRPWPEEMSLENGFTKGEDKRLAARRRETDGATTRFLDERQMLALVCELTATKAATLRKAVCGPGANPARRFAVWAFKDGTALTHAQIGAALRMSPQQVAHVLRRLRFDTEPFRSWIVRWREETKVSSGGF
jgi:REP element-mobilizing transposase RayT